MNSLLIEQNGQTNLMYIENISREILYKKCNYRKNSKFKLIYDMPIEDNINLELWGKEGPRETNLFKFSNILNECRISGACILIKCNKDDRNILEITEEDIKYIIINNEESKNNSNNEDDDEDNNDIIDYNSELEPDEYLYSSEEDNQK